MAEINRPNFNNVHTRYRNLGDNTLRRTFANCFNIMLSSCYNDYTKGGRFYNSFENGESKYYVEQPEIESQLKEFSDKVIDDDYFLVGFTGIGKTTLIKNFFKIENSNPFVNEKGDLIAYLSVYSDDIKSEEDIDILLEEYQKSIISYLNEFYPFSLDSEANITEFYNYAKNNKNRLLNNWDPFATKETKKEILKKLLKEHNVQFYSIYIKFLLAKINHQSQKIKNIILIFDDIESQDKDTHIPFISKVLNISSCLRNTQENRHYSIKSLISLRAYTFRYHKARQSNAKRVYEENVILKSTIPSMKDIFIKRFNVYYQNKDVRNIISDENRWLQSKNVLIDIVNNLADFGDMISSIAHYDISRSLSLFLKVVTNKRWFAPNESYYEGSYPNPELDNYTFSTKERIYKALFYGEGEVFVDNDENILPNFLYIHYEDNYGYELLNLYILEYMKHLERNNTVTLYGKNRIVGKELSKKLSDIFQDDSINEKVNDSIKYLYEKEYLLHSIYEPEEDDLNKGNIYRREYKDDYGLYLSIRGSKALEMLETDSMLLEIYRDDIDTEIEHNTILTSRMNQTDKMIYLIKYCRYLFEKEKHYISLSKKEEYFKMFGNKFIVTRLIKGIKQSFIYFYRKNDENAQFVRKNLFELFDLIEQYKTILKKDFPNSNNIDTSFIDRNI